MRSHRRRERGLFLYAEDGSRLKPRCIRPNRRKLFGFVVEQDEYELELASDQDTDTGTFEIAIAEACGLEPNRYFSSVPEIRAHVKKCQNAHYEETSAQNSDTGSWLLRPATSVHGDQPARRLPVNVLAVLGSARAGGGHRQAHGRKL